jgi:hypothetical protein
MQVHLYRKFISRLCVTMSLSGHNSKWYGVRENNIGVDGSGAAEKVIFGVS